MRTVHNVLEEATASSAPVWYLLMPGNAGDALISVGFFDLAKQVGLRYTTTTDVDEIPTGAFVFVNGGGYLVPEWGGESARRKIETLIRTAGRLALMPMSVRGFDDVFQGLPAGTDVFLRERHSFDHVARIAPPGVNVLLDDDTAFHVDVASLKRLERIHHSWRSASGKDNVRYLLYRRAKAFSRVTKGIKAFRRDPESARSASRLTVLSDVSLLAFFGGSDESECRYSAALFVDVLDGYHRVVTDRLHTAVAAALLGKQVTMVEGSYYKLGGVYDQSMSDWPNVTYTTHA